MWFIVDFIIITGSDIDFPIEVGEYTDDLFIMTTFYWR